MTLTALEDALSLITQVPADTRRAWAASPWLIGPASLDLAMRSAAGVCRAVHLTTALCVLWLALGAGTTHAASPPAPLPAEVSPVEAAFREALQLWADEQFEVLWARGLLSSRYRISRDAGGGAGLSRPLWPAGVGLAQLHDPPAAASWHRCAGRGRLTETSHRAAMAFDPTEIHPHGNALAAGDLRQGGRL